MLSEAARDNLDNLLAERERGPLDWQPPTKYDLSNPEDRLDLQGKLDGGEIEAVVDPIGTIADELYDIKHPGEKTDEDRRRQFTGEIACQGSAFGQWFHFPWRKELVRYPDQDDHRDLRTARFKNLVTDAEQQELYGSAVAVYGLSVGSSVLESVTLSGIGGRIIMGDPDRMAPTNGGRIRANFAEMGERKLAIAARKLSELDPYVEQVHHDGGFSPAVMEQLADERPDVLFDEVDHLPSKALMRVLAQRLGIPLVMATDLGDRSIIDVERYDQGGAKPFHGKVSKADMDGLVDGTIPEEQLQKLTVKIVGMRHVTTRMLQSVMEIDKSIAGMPQLGNTATIGGAMSALTAREIILGRDMPTGRYVFNPRKTLGLQAQASVPESLRTFGQFVRSAKQR
jgi:hypothetical protein